MQVIVQKYPKCRKRPFFIIIELYIFELVKLAKSRRMEEDSNYFIRACKTVRAHLYSQFSSNSDPGRDLLGKDCRCFPVTESQNGVIWKAPLESNPPAQAGTLTAGYPDLCPDGF